MSRLCFKNNRWNGISINREFLIKFSQKLFKTRKQTQKFQYFHSKLSPFKTFAIQKQTPTFLFKIFAKQFETYYSYSFILRFIFSKFSRGLRFHCAVHFDFFDLPGSSGVNRPQPNCKYILACISLTREIPRQIEFKTKKREERKERKKKRRNKPVSKPPSRRGS